MLAIDTNVVIRFLTRDDPVQAGQAREIVSRQPVFVGVTVMLESEWVLRSVYGFTRLDVCRALRAFAGLPTVQVEDAAAVVEAFDRMEAGMDLADALHLARAAGCRGLATFDRRFLAAALRLGLDAVLDAGQVAPG